MLNSKTSNVCTTVVTNSSDFLMTLFWVIDGFCPSFLVDHPFVFSLCWMLYFFCPCFLINNPLLLCNSWMVYCLVNCFLVNNPLILSLCRMLNFLRPSFLVYLPLFVCFSWVLDLLCPSFLVDNLNSLRVTLLSYKRNFLCPSFFVDNRLIVTFFLMFNSLSPSRLIHNPHISITFFCLIYRNKGCKITSINSNSNTVNIIGRNNTNSSHCQCYSHY